MRLLSLEPPFFFFFAHKVIKLLKLKCWLQRSQERIRFARLVGKTGPGQSLEVCGKEGTSRALAWVRGGSYRATRAVPVGWGLLGPRATPGHTSAAGRRRRRLSR